MNWAHVGFAHPWFLCLLAALPVLALLHSAKGAAPAVTYSALAPFRELGAVRRSRTGGFLLGLLLASLACFIVAFARPQQVDTLSRSEASGIDIMLALDVSGSMLAEDIQIGKDHANRLEAVKKVTADFIDGRPNDRIGVVAFAGRPYLVSPLTLDHDWLQKNLVRLRIGMVEDGTAIGSAIASCANRLKDRKESKSRIIVLLTDGGNNAGKVSPPTAAEAAHALGIKIYTIGVGSNGMAPIPVRDSLGRTFYRMIPADLDADLLEKLAKIGEGEFYRATNSKALQEIFKKIDTLEKSTIEFSERKEVKDLFPWCLGAGLAFLLLNILVGQTVLRRIP